MRWSERTRPIEDLAALKRGDEVAFSRFVHAHQDRVYHVVLRLLGSVEEARDVTQDVFVTLYEKLPQYRGSAKLSTWVYRVAVNHAKNRIRYLVCRRDRDQTSFEAMLNPPSDGRLSAAIPRPDEALAGRDLEAFLQRALMTLDADQRQVVVLRDIEGLSYEAIGEILGLQAGTVKSRLHRGRLILKRALTAWQAGQDPTRDAPRGPGEIT